MRELGDKLLLLACCVTLLLGGSAGPDAVALDIAMLDIAMLDVAALLAAVTAGALNVYFGRRFLLGSSLVWLALCCWQPVFLTYLPLLAYDMFGGEWKALYGLWLIPAAMHMDELPVGKGLTLLVFVALALVLRLRLRDIRRYRDRYRRMQDGSREISLHLEEKNRALLEKQDVEVRLATLNERNRIAREIHDNVGHLLSRSILQVGALLVVNRDETVREGLSTVKRTLSDAMDSIRRSVHDLHDESVDLRAQLSAVTRAFTFCPVRLDYDTGEMDKALKYAFIAIVKEALSNVAKHSDATAVTVTVREHPALYQLIVQDNGAHRPPPDERGIGLRNMADRVEAFHGTFRAGGEKGFRIFVAVPKERTVREGLG